MHTCRHLGPRDEEWRMPKAWPEGPPLRVFKGENHPPEASDQWTKPRRRPSEYRSKGTENVWTGQSDLEDRTNRSVHRRTRSQVLVWTGQSDWLKMNGSDKWRKAPKGARVCIEDRSVRPVGSDKYSRATLFQVLQRSSQALQRTGLSEPEDRTNIPERPCCEVAG